MLKLAYDAARQRADLVRAGGNLQLDAGLETAVLVSLFTDARVDDPAMIGGPGSDPRGWWGDAYARVPGDRLGSTLWVLHRKGFTDEVRREAAEAAKAALRWLVDDGVAASVDVEVLSWRPEVCALRVRIKRPDDPVSVWERLWEVSLGL